jgi:hypothetical protein
MSDSESVVLAEASGVCPTCDREFRNLSRHWAHVDEHRPPIAVHQRFMFYPLIEDSGDRQNMSEMSNSDVELVYKYLNDRVRSDVEADAYELALETFDQLDDLEAANDDEDSAFSWDGIWFEMDEYDRDRERLIPLTGVEHTREPEIYEIASDFGWLVVENIRDEIRKMQEETILSPREFVALVLDAEWGERAAARIMDISVGNFRGKKGTISEKLNQAEATETRVEKIRAE